MKCGHDEPSREESSFMASPSLELRLNPNKIKKRFQNNASEHRLRIN